MAYTYSLANNGTDTLFHVSVSDDSCAPVAYQSGDVNHDQLLQPGETWIFTCSHTYSAAGSFTNHATATGTGSQTGLAVTSNTPRPPSMWAPVHRSELVGTAGPPARSESFGKNWEYYRSGRFGVR